MIFLMAILFNFLSCVLPQEPSSFFESRKHSLFVLRLSDGRFDVRELSLGNIKKDDDVLGILQNDVAREELSMTPEQGQKLDRVILELTEELSGYSALEKENSKERIEELRAALEAHASQIDDVLLPHQKTRLKELLVRLEISRQGILQYLDSGKIEGITLSSDERARIGATMKPKIAELKKQVTDELGSHFEKVTNVLRSQQQELFKARYGETLVARLPPLEVVIWQAKNLERVRKQVDGVKHEHYPGLSLNGVYQMDFDGTLFGSNVLGKRDVDMVQTSFTYAHSLLANLSDEFLRKELELTATQTSAIEQLRERKDHQTDEQWSIGVLDKLDDLLLEHQKLNLKVWAECSEFVKGGIGYALCYGESSKFLKLDDAQKMKIREIEEKFAQKMDELFDREEQEIFECITKELEPSQQLVFRSAVGEPLRFLSGNISLMINQLEEFVR